MSDKTIQFIADYITSPLCTIVIILGLIWAVIYFSSQIKNFLKKKFNKK